MQSTCSLTEAASAGLLPNQLDERQCWPCLVTVVGQHLGAELGAGAPASAVTLIFYTHIRINFCHGSLEKAFHTRLTFIDIFARPWPGQLADLDLCDLDDLQPYMSHASPATVPLRDEVAWQSLKAREAHSAEAFDRSMSSNSSCSNSCRENIFIRHETKIALQMQTMEAEESCKARYSRYSAVIMNYFFSLPPISLTNCKYNSNIYIGCCCL